MSQIPAPRPGAIIARAEFERLKADNERLKAENEQLRAALRSIAWQKNTLAGKAARYALEGK